MLADCRSFGRDIHLRPFVARSPELAWLTTGDGGLRVSGRRWLNSSAAVFAAAFGCSLRAQRATTTRKRSCKTRLIVAVRRTPLEYGANNFRDSRRIRAARKANPRSFVAPEGVIRL